MSLLREVTDNAIAPALKLLPGYMDSPQARVMLLAIGLQESALTHRAQILTGGKKGPARGLWQMERGGGVLGVLTHRASRKLAHQLCAAFEVHPDSREVWEALESNDILAAALARLLLWTDPLALPAVDDDKGAWALYLRVWRPGKPRPEHWAPYHRMAREFVAGRP